MAFNRFHTLCVYIKKPTNRPLCTSTLALSESIKPCNDEETFRFSIPEKPKHLDAKQSVSLYKILDMQPDAYRAMRIFHWTVSQHQEHDPAHKAAMYQQFLCLLLKSRHYDSTMEILRSSGNNLFPGLFETLITVYCLSKFYKEAIHALRDMKGLGFTPSVETYNLFLRCLVRSYRTDLLWEFYKDMDDEGIQINCATVSSIICGYCLEGRLKEAKVLLHDVLDNGWVPGIQTFDKVIAGYSRAGDFDTVSQIMHLMIRKGAMPDVSTYNEVIHGMCKSCMVYKGMQLFEDIKSRGYEPDIVTYTMLIDGFMKIGKVGEAMELWAEARNIGLPASDVTFNMLIAGYCKQGDVDKAWELLERFKREGFRASVWTYNTFISVYCKRDDVVKAECLKKEMDDQGLIPDTVTYNSLIQGHSKQGDFEKAFGYYTELLANGLKPSLFSYAPLIHRLCKKGEIKVPMMLFCQTLQRGLVASILTRDLVLGHCLSGDVCGALHMFRAFIDMGLKPEKETFEILVEGLSADSLERDALWVLSRMFEYGHKPSEFIFGSLVFRFCGEDAASAGTSFENLLTRIITMTASSRKS